MSSSDDDDDDVQPAALAWQPPSLAQLQADDDDDDDSDDDGVEPPAKRQATEASATAAATTAAASSPLDTAGQVEAEDEGASSVVLPSALDALHDSEGQDFLEHKYTPEFDASKNFKPPPVTAADLGPATGSERSQMGYVASVPPPRGWQGEHHFKRADEDQRHSSEYNFGRQPGSVRLRGSVCHETDDERGRRVRYGAHAALAADPWSACNPNYSVKDSKVTRGQDRRGIEGQRRPRGDTR